MNTKELPLVSCIMPTYNRRKFVAHAINYFLRQDYGNKELIVIDDGTDAVEDLMPNCPFIRYFYLNKKITLGAKLNLACSYAQGEIIANWDDDDWYCNTRLSYQVDALKNNTIDVCGINNLLYYDLQNKCGYRYIYPANQKTWLLGSSLCYTKKLWCNNRFADIDVGMDGLFVWATSPENIKVLTDSAMSVHMIHENNVSPKKTNGKWWHSYPVNELQKILKDDWTLYEAEIKPSGKKIVFNHASKSQNNHAVEPLKNIYACLVHDNEDCIIDLVRNLHYHDPSSTILLFNGGNNKNLFPNHFPFQKFGAVIHPKSFPVKHGYLHPFALSCMQFSLENFPFDSFTIVDSDQLAVRSNYSSFLKEHLTSSNIGMLSPKPKRLTKNDISDTQVWPALQAFKEYELWKPLLQQFNDGESKFVHWTFWPSTVFTNNAARDLVKLFKENKLLNQIMNQTKIWATEEVILSTLVRLLGYEIVLNPCSYEFVKFRKTFSTQEATLAFKNQNAYWMHPVERKYDDAVRKHARQQFNHYISTQKQTVSENCCDIFLRTTLINKIKKIEGWLTDEEAELLIEITLKCCKEFEQSVVVEVGSYHGRSTVLFGSILKNFSSNIKVYSIDPHDGKLGATDQGLQYFPPSYEKLKQNIQREELSDVVEIIKNNAWNVEWNKPISFLFVDGLHDYPNVAKDFYHFSSWIEVNGYVAFHDYADYFPGVKAFVHELLETDEYEKICEVDTLVVLKKHKI